MNRRYHDSAKYLKVPMCLVYYVLFLSNQDETSHFHVDNASVDIICNLFYPCYHLLFCTKNSKFCFLFSNVMV